jgi:hypothetical protein
MMLTVSTVLVALALVFLVLAIVGKVPLWIAILCLLLDRLLMLVPPR